MSDRVLKRKRSAKSSEQDDLTEDCDTCVQVQKFRVIGDDRRKPQWYSDILGLIQAGKLLFDANHNELILRDLPARSEVAYELSTCQTRGSTNVQPVRSAASTAPGHEPVIRTKKDGRLDFSQFDGLPDKERTLKIISCVARGIHLLPCNTDYDQVPIDVNGNPMDLTKLNFYGSEEDDDSDCDSDESCDNDGGDKGDNGGNDDDDSNDDDDDDAGLNEPVESSSC